MTDVMSPSRPGRVQVTKMRRRSCRYPDTNPPATHLPDRAGFTAIAANVPGIEPVFEVTPAPLFDGCCSVHQQRENRSAPPA